MLKTKDSIVGKLIVTRTGDAIVPIPKSDLIVTVPKHKRNTALHRDSVEVILGKKRPDKNFDAESVTVLRRSSKGFAGTLHERAGTYAVTALAGPETINIAVPKEGLGGATSGDEVFVDVTEYGALLTGTITQKLKDLKDLDRQMYILSHEKGFSEDFPRNVLDEAEAIAEHGITEDDLKGRRDFRDTETFTIDPETAKDFDDALSVVHNEKTIEIGVHIADVSWYVRTGTALDDEAKSRATSVYLADRTIPMLPEALSNDLCSLVPGETRLTFSVVATYSHSGDLLDSWVGRGIIHSDKRFTYEEAQEVLESGTGPHALSLRAINTIAKKRTEERRARGGLMLEKEEVSFILGDDGIPIGITKKERAESNLLIEEYMLLANEIVAEKIVTSSPHKLGIYRTHGTPDARKVEDLTSYLASLGYEVSLVKGLIPPLVLAKVLREARSDIERDAISIAIAKSMQKAEYSIVNTGHFGLALANYTHFTSPIRRYPDIMVHRILTSIIEGNMLNQKSMNALKETARHSTDREIDAQEAERGSTKHMNALYFSKHIGTKFTGMISGLTRTGIFVRDPLTLAEGMIRYSDIPGDFYSYDTKKNIARGQKTGKEFRIGSELPVYVHEVDIEMDRINLRVTT